MKVFDRKIWLASPTMHGEEQKFVQEAFDTNWVSTVGENINELERGIRQYVGCDYAVALSAGTAALHLSVKLAGVKPGDRVFCTDMTFAATVNPVVYEQGIPVFIDSEEDSWNMDPEALRKAFEKYPDTKVVIVANLYGTCAKLDEIRAICDEHGAILIEDAAESLGAFYKGTASGTFGKYNAISFNGNKIITTSGGGMFLTDEKEAAEKVRKWSTQSRDKASWYQHTELGYNYRMSNIVAGIGRGQLLHLEEHIALKKKIYERYQKGFQDLPVQMNPVPKECKANYWLSCITINKEAMCQQNRTDDTSEYQSEPGKSCPDEIISVLASHNAEARPIWKPMHLQPIFADCDFISMREKDFVSDDVFERGLCLPSDIKMTEEEQLQIIEIIKSCFAK